MVVINLAYSAPINPSGVSPILTQTQVWNGLKRKVRKAHEFVAPILECEVISEEDTETGPKIIRQVKFDKSTRGDQDEYVKEVVYEFEPSRIDFYLPDGSKVFNIVGVDQDGNLVMTYAFEWRHPDIAPNSEQAKEQREKYLKMSKGAVESSINTIRKLAKEGEL